MSDTEGCAVATFIVELNLRYASVIRYWNRDLFDFIKENSCSQTEILANIDMAFDANSFIWG